MDGIDTIRTKAKYLVKKIELKMHILLQQQKVVEGRIQKTTEHLLKNLSFYLRFQKEKFDEIDKEVAEVNFSVSQLDAFRPPRSEVKHVRSYRKFTVNFKEFEENPRDIYFKVEEFK